MKNYNIPPHSQHATGLNVNLFGCIGGDYLGHVIKSLMKRHSIDLSHLKVKSGRKTSATVINVRDNGERPGSQSPLFFFHTYYTPITPLQNAVYYMNML